MRTPHKYLLTGTGAQWVLKPSPVPSHWAGTEGQRALRWKGGAGLLAPHSSCIHSPPTSSKYILPNGLCKGSTAQNISLLKIAELEFSCESFRARQSCLPRAFFPFKGVLIWKTKSLSNKCVVLGRMQGVQNPGACHFCCWSSPRATSFLPVAWGFLLALKSWTLTQTQAVLQPMFHYIQRQEDCYSCNDVWRALGTSLCSTWESKGVKKSLSSASPGPCELSVHSNLFVPFLLWLLPDTITHETIILPLQLSNCSSRNQSSVL